MARKQEELLLSVADVLLIDSKSNAEYASATLKTHSISQSVDTSEIRAGRNNAVIATLESNKTITVEIEDVHANRDWIAIAMDAELKEKTNFEGRALPTKLVVEDGLKITLPHEPKTASEVKFFTSERAEVTGTVTGKVATLQGVQVGDVIEVSSYRMDVEAADVMEIGGEGVGRAFSMYLEESVSNNNMEIIAIKQTFFPRVVPDSTFSMEGSSEMAEQNVTYTFTVAQAEGYDYLGQIIYIPVE